MLEKRQAVRYRVQEDTDVVIFQAEGDLVAPLIDLSQTGMMTALPEAEWAHFRPGQELAGLLRNHGAATDWHGKVIHRSLARNANGIGIAFTDQAGATVFDAVRTIVRQPDAGGLHLRRGEPGMILEVYGRLSFLTSRDCLSYIRHEVIDSIDLSHCSSVDSAGLGMLCLARERRIAVVGAQGVVSNLLAIARIDQADWDKSIMGKGRPVRQS